MCHAIESRKLWNWIPLDPQSYKREIWWLSIFNHFGVGSHRITAVLLLEKKEIDKQQYTNILNKQCPIGSPGGRQFWNKKILCQQKTQEVQEIQITFRNANPTATFSVSLVLFMIGLLTLYPFLARDMTRYVKENLNLSIVLSDEITKIGFYGEDRAILFGPRHRNILEFIGGLIWL